MENELKKEVGTKVSTPKKKAKKVEIKTEAPKAKIKNVCDECKFKPGGLSCTSCIENKGDK